MSDFSNNDEGFEPQGEELFAAGDADLPNWMRSPAYEKAKTKVLRIATVHGNPSGDAIMKTCRDMISELGGDPDGDDEEYMYDMASQLMDVFLEKFEEYMPFPFR